jgi:hypothetical protein
VTLVHSVKYAEVFFGVMIKYTGKDPESNESSATYISLDLARESNTCKLSVTVNW